MIKNNKKIFALQRGNVQAEFHKILEESKCQMLESCLLRKNKGLM